MSEVNTTPEVVPNVVNDKNSTQNTAENDEIKGEESLKQNNDKDKESPDKIITKEVINDNDNDKEATDNKKVENEEQNNEVKPQSPSQQIQDCRKTSEGDSEDDAAAPKRRRTTSLVADSPCSSENFSIFMRTSSEVL
ncbi:unnamed protein product [Anisakis simplex]|uniref:Uncharacterized protein n=1 Tax=Anisakis simplex TaxID=6269 RepID=A0A0M3JWF0_ANISI|nr:unnamed protein product [Anisakis simplex]